MKPRSRDLSHAIARSLTYLVAAAAAVLFVAYANRGMDLTDESYYLLQYENWREYNHHLTFFGAYLDVAFRAMDGSVASIRIVGALLLCITGGFFAKELHRYFRSELNIEEDESLDVFAWGVAGALMFFGFMWTLRAPSYNTLTLVSLLYGTALLFRICRDAKVSFGTGVLYGLSMSIAVFNKPTAGASAAMVHVAFFLLRGNRPLSPRVWAVALSALLGAFLNVAYLTLRHPRWFMTVVDGVAWSQRMGDRHLLASLRAMPWVVPYTLTAHAPTIGLLIFALILAHRARRSARTDAMSYVVPLVVALLAGVLSAPGAESTWMVLIALVAATLWVAGIVHRDHLWIRSEDGTILSLSLLLFVLPLCYSLGTGIALVQHTRMAIIFPLSALTIILQWLRHRKIVSLHATRVSISVLAIPAIAAQALPLTDAAFTYRLRSPLPQQATPINIGRAFRGLYVDSTTNSDLVELKRSFGSAGFNEGDGILDFAGDSPGIVYVAGGHPLGVPWMLGGYPGSRVAAAFVLERLTTQQLQRAWILTSETNPRRIENWADLLQKRLGASCFEVAATVKIRPTYSWSGPLRSTAAPNELKLWRPLAHCRS